MDVPAGVTQEEGHTGFLIHLPSAVRALIFFAKRIQPLFSLVDREVEFCVLTILIVLHLLGIFFFFFFSKTKLFFRDSSSRPNVSEGFEVTSEQLGRPATVDVRYCRLSLLLYCTVLCCPLYSMYHNPIKQNPSFYAMSSPYKTHVCTTVLMIPFLHLTHSVTM